MKLDDLLLNTETKLVIDSYLKEPPHAILLTGLPGIGLRTLANALANELTPHASSRFSVEPEGATITIDNVRAMYRQTRASQTEKEVILIDNADQMSHDAQNAFLKLLEEPTAGRYFVLTTHATNQLLPTIHSRLQAIALKPITVKASEALVKKYSLNEAQQTQAMFMASGLPAELTRLAEDPVYFTAQAEHMIAARKLLESREFERLGIISHYTDRIKALQLVTVLGRLIIFSLRRQPKAAFLDMLDVVETVSERLQANGNVRTQLMYLVTKLP